uniref:Uncharacterized protein n=1 Tax=Arundo donax TaxID=35708 RepID=A0A0A8ZLL7_ARUDO
MWHPLITKDARSLASFHPPGFNSMVNIFIDVAILL